VDLDTIILAAGRGARLRGVVPAYHKPLLVVDGQALIVTTIKQVRDVTKGRIVVVVAPENASPITNLLEDAGLIDYKTFFIVQPTPNGPGDAFILGSELALTEHVLVLMSDNLYGPDDIHNVANGDADVVIGTHKVQDADVARNFTRVTTHGTYEGPVIDVAQTMEGWYHLWLGPLRVHRRRLIEELGETGPEGEVKIGPWLGNVGSIETVTCLTHDVGDVNGLTNGG
jgi:choline kinase